MTGVHRRDTLFLQFTRSSHAACSLGKKAFGSASSVQKNVGSIPITRSSLAATILSAK